MLFKRMKEGVLEIFFPPVCTVCGMRLSPQEHFVCTQCLDTKFELAKREGMASTSDVLLPEGIYLQHALWNFDKGGYLQELLHQLKYQRLTGIGEDIGRQLGKSLLNNSFFMQKIEGKKARLLPVPLHPRKRRIRGYNQALHVAKGVADVTNLPILKREVVLRVKNTRTQTGFTLEKRRTNISNAFEVAEPERIQGTICVIIDDVFTTGATTFELASNLQSAGCSEIVIATAAQA